MLDMFPQRASQNMRIFVNAACILYLCLITDHGLILATAVVPSADLSPSECCPPSWKGFENSCYRLTLEDANYDDARSACHGMGGEMTAPRSSEENAMIVEMAQNQAVWIACSDRVEEGQWECDGRGSGESFFNWRPSEPNNHNDLEHCIAAPSADGLWNDRKCSDTYGAVCVRRDVCVHHSSRRPGRYCLSANVNGRILNSACLFDHVIREFVSNGVATCGSACIAEPGCRSFNVKNDGGELCQLNNSTRLDAQDKFQDTGYFCTYFEV